MAYSPTRLFLRVAFRNWEAYLLKFGSLAIAFAAFLAITQFALNEFGFDRFHRDDQKVYRILKRNNDESYTGNRLTNRIPPNVMQQLRTNAGDSITLSRIKVMENLSVTTDAGSFPFQKMHAADSSVIDVLSFEPLSGTMSEFRKSPGTVLLSASAARQYFNSIDVVGRRLMILVGTDSVWLNVAAVYRDFPSNSHEDFRLILRFDTTTIRTLGFNPADAALYARLNSDEIDRHVPQLAMNVSNAQVSYLFQPITSIYFGPRVMGEDAQHGDAYSIILLLSITTLIVFMAVTSYVNLTTLTLPGRSREVAIKKLAGTQKGELLAGFASESYTVVAVSLAAGLLLLTVASPFIPLHFTWRAVDFRMICLIVALVLIVGGGPVILALKFARATPTRLLSAETLTFPAFKRVIIFLQLGTSIFLIISALVIRRQVTYSLLKEPGRNYDQVVYLRYPAGLTKEGLRSLQLNWKQSNPNIVDVIAGSQLPDRINSKELGTPFYRLSVDPSFIDFFKLQVLAGRWFRANDGDSLYLINSAGQRLMNATDPNNIGVISEVAGAFNQPEKPIKINLVPVAKYNYLCIRILEVDIGSTVSYLKRYFETAEGQPEVNFLDRHFAEWITYQDRLNSSSGLLTVLAALLSCGAIYGLSISIVRDKLKPIAVRKLLGATPAHITVLLVTEFARPMVIALLVFGPLTYIVLTELLRSFVYATHFQWSDAVIPLGYCTLVIIALCGFHAMILNRTDLTRALKA